MKVRCDVCGSEAELRFVIAEGASGRGIEATCAACGARTFVAEETAASIVDAPRPREGEQECPKCGEVQPRADACRRCGLVFVRWKGGAGGAPGEDAEAARLWEEALASWSAAPRHDAFIAYCQRTLAFPFAAGRYRGVVASGARPANDPVVVRSLERIEKLALTNLELSAQRERGAAGGRAAGPLPYRNTMMALVALVALVVLALVWTMFRAQRRDVEELREPDGVRPVQPVAPVPAPAPK